MHPSTVMIQGLAKAFIGCDLGSNAIFTPFEKEDGDSSCSTMCCQNRTDLISESLSDEQLAFLRTELETDSQMPTLLCGHIPSVSVLPNLGVCGETKTMGANIETPDSLLTHNASDLHHVLYRDQGERKTGSGRSSASFGADSN